MSNLPSNWQFKSLGDICNITTGDKDVNEGDSNGEYPFFTCAAGPLRSAGYSFDGESILLPGNGANVGLALYYNGKFEAYQRTYVLNNFSADVKYVFFHLKERWKKSQENKQFGSATNYIRYDNIASYKIPLPPLPIQKQIAEILEKADQAKQKRREANKLTDEFLQSVFIEMFGDPVKNPKGWVVGKVEDISSKVTSGSTPLGGDSNYLSEGILFIRSQNILMNRIDYSDISFISETIHKKMSRTWVKKDDVLLNITGASIGRVAYFEGKDDSANVNQHVCIIRTKKDKINHIYLSYLISSDSFQSKVIAQNAGATRQAFNFEQIKNFKVILPPLALQQQFAEIVNKTEALKEKQKQSEQELENLFQSLMQKAFKGELVA